MGLDYGILSAIISPIFSSVATIFKSGATKSLSPLAVGGFGSLIGGFLILLFLLVRKKGPLFGKLKENKGDFLKLVALRAVIGEILFVFGLSMTTAIKSIFLTKTEPYFVLILSWLARKESIKPMHVLLLTLNVFGAILLSTAGDVSMVGASQFGDILIVAAMFLFAMSYFYGKRLSEKVGATTTNAFTQLLGGLLLLPLVIIFVPAAEVSSPTGWYYLLMFVLLFNVLGLTLWYFSLKTVRPWMVSALRAIGPIAGAPIAFFMFGDTLNTIQLVGAAIVLASSTMIVYEHRKSKA